MNVWNWVLIVAGAVLILVEASLGGFAGFDLVLIGSAFVLGGGLGLAFGSPVAGFITASVLCILYIAIGRRMVRSRIHTPKVRTNTDALVDREGVVVQRIADHEAGQVKLGDEVWRVEPAPGAGPFEPGARVTVAGIHGVTLQVR